MARKAKPFLHQGHYYTTQGGKWVKLCREADGLSAAVDLLAALVAGESPRPAPATLAAAPAVPPAPAGVSLAAAIAQYLGHCANYYRLPGGEQSSEPRNIALAFGYLTRAAGQIAATELTKEHLKSARATMAATCSRKTCNQHVGRIKRGAKWLADEGVIPDTVAASLSLLLSGVRA